MRLLCLPGQDEDGLSLRECCELLHCRFPPKMKGAVSRAM